MENLQYRSFDAAVNDNGKLTGVASTQTPVPMYDSKRNAYIPEVLLMSGAQLPPDGKVPLLDSHQRDSVKNQLGSARLYVEGDRLMAEPEISSAHPDVQTLVAEKHLKGLSIGYRIDEPPTYIPQNKSEIYEGRSYDGPMNLVKRFTVRELSLTPIQADPYATLRKENSDHSPLDKENPTVGDLTDRMETENKTPENNTPEETRAVETRAVENNETRQVDVEKIVQERIEAERKLARGVRDECKRQGLADYADEIIDSCKTRAEANARILELLAEKQTKVAPVNLVAGRSHHEKTVDALKTGLEARCLGPKFDRVVPKEERGMGWETTKRMRLVDVARACLELNGEDTRMLFTDRDVAERALLHQREDNGNLAYLTTGNFPSLLLNVQNKVLLQAYNEATPTFREVFRIGPSARDFKPLYRMRKSAVGLLDIWPEGAPPQQAQITDKKETFSVDSFGKEITVSYQAIVNDDLNAFAEMPADLARAALRSQNQFAWACVLNNSNLSDGNPFFDSTHNNVIASGGGKPNDIDQMASMYNLFRSQKGMAGEYLNPNPKYLVVPTGLESYANAMVRSQYDPSANQFQTYSMFAANNSQLKVIVEPWLNVNADEWYLMGAQEEAIGEFVYLEGQESPFLSSYIDMKTQCHIFTIRQSWGCALIDYQYGARNKGAA